MLLWASQEELVVKNPPANAEEVRDRVLSLAWEDPLEDGMATHSSILAWHSPWTEEPGGLQSIGSQVRHYWSYWEHWHVPWVAFETPLASEILTVREHVYGCWDLELPSACSSLSLCCFFSAPHLLLCLRAFSHSYSASIYLTPLWPSTLFVSSLHNGFCWRTLLATSSTTSD